MKHQVLFSLKNNEKIFMNVICCSHDWHFNKGLITQNKNSMDSGVWLVCVLSQNKA